MAQFSLFEKAGTKVPANLTDYRVSTVFNSTGLDWTIEQQPIYSQYGEITNLKANYRSDNKSLLGVVSDRYKVVQNVDAFDFIDSLPNFTFEKVGQFNGGRKIFIVGKPIENMYLDGQSDEVKFYLTFVHGHDGMTGIKFIICPIRMFCMNQLNMMLKTADFKYSIKHTGDIDFKIKQVHDAVSRSHNYISEFGDSVRDMINSSYTGQISEFVEQLIPIEANDTERVTNRKQEVKDMIIDLYENKNDLQNYRGTKFGVLSAVSDFISHAEPQRNSNKADTIASMFIKNTEGNVLIEKARELLAA